MHREMRIRHKISGGIGSIYRPAGYIFMAAAVSAFFWAVAPAALAADPVTGLAPLAPQPEKDKLKPGLAVTYYFNIFNYINEISEFAKIQKGVRGKPIPMLNYKVGPGKVLTSDRVNGVGADIRGLMHFAKPGTYTIAMQSNDGVRLEIGGKQIILDPKVHVDRFSPLVRVRVNQAGWYPISILYFEKRNTSTLELYWIKPKEDTSLKFVPSTAFAHLQN